MINTLDQTKHHEISIRKFDDADLISGEVDGHMNLDDYSRMKHGSHLSARKIARDFASEFKKNHSSLVENREVVILPAAFNFSPIASSILARYVLIELADNGFGATFSWDTVKRSQNYIADYQHMSLEERKTALEADVLTPHKEFLGDRTLLFIDDVHITGTHTEGVKRMLHLQGMENEVIIATYGQYLGKNPQTEAVINHWSIRSHEDLVELSYEPQFEMTLRGAKFMLKLEGSSFESHFRRLSDQGKSSMYAAMVGKNYHRHENFTKQTEIIKEILKNG